jgi:hypothetical protein
VDISLISGLPPSISIFAFGYCCCSCFLSAFASVSFPIFAFTFVPSGVRTMLIEYPLVGELSNGDSVSLKRGPPNSSSIMLRFFLGDMGVTNYLNWSCALKTYQTRVVRALLRRLVGVFILRIGFSSFFR